MKGHSLLAMEVGWNQIKEKWEFIIRTVRWLLENKERNSLGFKIY